MRARARSRAALVAAAVLLAACSPQPPTLSEAERALGREIDFPEEVLLEAKRHAVEPLRRLNGADEDFEAVPVDGVSISVPSRHARAALDALRSALAPRGYLAFRHEMNFGHGPDELAILRTTDQFDALRTMRTNGINQDIDTPQILARLLDWHRSYGLAIHGAGLDFIEATFIQQPSDMDAFAREVYEFCPDVVDQGAQSVRALAEEMKRTNALFLWWD